MNTLIDNMKNATDTVKALGVTVGGLLGVFVTLGFFFFLIWIADKTDSKKKNQ
jgi:hypothetical protein